MNNLSTYIKLIIVLSVSLGLFLLYIIYQVIFTPNGLLGIH